jgi:hypothetical protein
MIRHRPHVGNPPTARAHCLLRGELINRSVPGLARPRSGVVHRGDDPRGFFKVLGVVSDRLSPTRDIRIKGFLKQAEFVTLRMHRGETLENVRFIGSMDTRSLRGMPYQLANMVIVETTSGERILLRPDGIRSIRQMSGDPGVGPDLR